MNLPNVLNSSIEAAINQINSWFPSAAELQLNVIIREMLPAVLQTVTFGAEPHTFGVEWPTAAGATRVEIDATNAAAGNPAPNLARIGPATTEKALDNLQIQGSGAHVIVSNAEAVRFRSLTVTGLHIDGSDDDLQSAGDLGSRFLLVSILDANNEWLPTYTVPKVPANKVMPSMYGGATFNNRLLRFPAVKSTKLRLSLVSSGFPSDSYTETSIRLDGVTGMAEPLAADLELTAPSGQPQWAFPGELPAGTPLNYVDLRNALKLDLNADLPNALADGRALKADFTFTGKSGTAATFSFGQPKGALVREHTGMQRFDLRGEEVVLDLGEALDAAAPDAVTGDLAVKYLGLRVLAVQSDFPLESSEQVRGRVVAAEPVMRVLEEGALDGRDVAQFALIGRAPEACELDVQVFKYEGGQAGDPLGLPARLTLEAGRNYAAHWMDVPALENWSGATVVCARALSGRFLWAERERPLLRIVIRDPDPGGALLYLRNRGLTTDQFGIAVNETQQTWRAQNFNSQVFRSSMPQLYSDLFLTVDFTDLTLRYRR